MKRKHMLAEIRERLDLAILNNTSAHTEYIAELVLLVVEANGMKPPYSAERDWGCECGCKGRCEIGDRWEDV